jgi:competence protein ComGC
MNNQMIEPEGKGKLSLLMKIMIVIIIIGIFVAIATPEYLKYQAKPKASECKYNLDVVYNGKPYQLSEKSKNEIKKSRRKLAQKYLDAIYTAQKAYYSIEGNYASGDDCFKLLQFIKPDERSEYRYYCSSDKFVPCIRYGVCSPCRYEFPDPEILDFKEDSFTVFAIGNIDSDCDFDIWSINEAKILNNIQNDLDD